MKNIKLIALLSLFAVSCKTDGNEYQGTKDINFLAVSDLHYSPYSLCDNESKAGTLNSNESKCASLIKELHQAESKEWDKIFEKYLANEKVASQTENTNYSLYKLFLTQLEAVAKSENIEFVVILGDLLTHNFQDKFKQYSTLTQQQDVELFTKKTFEYLSQTINSKLAKNVDVYPVLGNNDSYISNYHFDNPATSNLYKQLSVIWKGKAQQLENSDTFVKKGGYYSIDLKKNDQKLTIVALNTNMLSRSAHTTENIDIDNQAKEQLTWLSNLFKAAKNPANKETKPDNTTTKNKFLVISHIPSGVDGYATSEKKDGSIVSFWKNPSNENAYVKTLTENAENIAGVLVAHTHHDGFQIIDSAKKLASSSVPALSPIRNNPGLKVFKLDKNNVLVDSTTHYFDAKEGKWAENPDSFAKNNSSAADLAHGYQILVDHWHKDAEVVDKNFLKRFVLNTDSSHLESKWKHYICAASDGMSANEYNNCLKKVTTKK